MTKKSIEVWQIEAIMCSVECFLTQWTRVNAPDFV